jgi:hypothetical protein
MAFSRITYSKAPVKNSNPVRKKMVKMNAIVETTASISPNIPKENVIITRLSTLNNRSQFKPTLQTPIFPLNPNQKCVTADEIIRVKMIAITLSPPQ